MPSRLITQKLNIENQHRLKHQIKLKNKKFNLLSMVMDRKPKHFQLTSNITSLVKKYAAYLFN